MTRRAFGDAASASRESTIIHHLARFHDKHELAVSYVTISRLRTILVRCIKAAFAQRCFASYDYLHLFTHRDCKSKDIIPHFNHVRKTVVSPYLFIVCQQISKKLVYPEVLGFGTCFFVRIVTLTVIVRRTQKLDHFVWFVLVTRINVFRQLALSLL